jgi:CheY-like chemotaxis protein
LRRILVSLLGNAIKFTPRGEVVLRVTMEATAQEVVLHFSIKDTGIGISLDHQKSIIEAFTQADGSMTRAYDGIGLGLTTAAQLVQVMGGRFWLESEVGTGSTFHFTASFGLGAPTFASPVADVVDLRDLRVLVIDDNATTRGFLEEILNGWRMVPTLAASATEAIAALRAAQEARRSFDLILTDFPMPGADGFVLAGTIEKDPVSADGTVVMLSSVRQLDEPGRCRELGMAACIFKPIDLAELRGVFQVTLGARSAERDKLAQNPPREALPSGRILVVEDNIINQLVARRLLETHGHTVLVANSGREALTMLAEAFVGFDCVFMDLKMPEMDGFECTTRIRDKEKLTGSHLPIIGITAYTELGEEARCLAAGMDAFLSKPLQPVKFFDVVDRLLAGSIASVSPAPR